jgi:hypothetical protein
MCGTPEGPQGDILSKYPGLYAKAREGTATALPSIVTPSMSSGTNAGRAEPSAFEDFRKTQRTLFEVGVLQFTYLPG